MTDPYARRNTAGRPAFAEESVRERVSLAVGSLAASAEPIQRRLFWAGMRLLPLLPGDFREFEDRVAFAEIARALGEANVRTAENDLVANTYSISDDEAVGISRQIVDLAISLASSPARETGDARATG